MTSSVEAGYNENYLVMLDEALDDQDSHSSVTYVDLTGNQIEASTMSDIAWKYLSHFNGLRELDLKANNMGPEGWQAVSQTLAAHCPNLEVLDISENQVLDEGTYNVAVFVVEMERLRTLSLITNSITPRGVPTLCDGLRHAAVLQELSLDYNALGDQGAVLIAECAGGLRALKRLGLSDNTIGDVGAEAIAAHIIQNARCRVRSLNLSCNKISDQGVLAIGTALMSRAGNAQLVSIDLGCNPLVSLESMTEFLRGCSRWVNLHSILLSSSKLTSEHARLLSSAICSHSSPLGYVEYYNNPEITQEAEVELSDAIERCEKVPRGTESGMFASRQKVILLATLAAVSLGAVAWSTLRRRK